MIVQPIVVLGTGKGIRKNDGIFSPLDYGLHCFYSLTMYFGTAWLCMDTHEHCVSANGAKQIGIQHASLYNPFLSFIFSPSLTFPYCEFHLPFSCHSNSLVRLFCNYSATAFISTIYKISLHHLPFFKNLATVSLICGSEGLCAARQLSRFSHASPQ